jgi:hypothetical protein
MLLFLVVLGLLYLLMAQFWPVGPDYFYTFRPLGEDFLKGTARLYDPNQYSYYNAPWGMLLILLTLPLPVNCGQSVWTVITLLGFVLLFYSVSVQMEPRKLWFPAIALAIANLHTFDLLIRGNMDGFLLLCIKPVNVVLALLVILWSMRDWDLRSKFISLAPLALTTLATFPIFGWDWPLRYLRYLPGKEPITYLQTTLWKALVSFGLERSTSIWIAIPVLLGFLVLMWKYRSVIQPNNKLVLALATNLAITPYALGSHYVLLAPAFGLAATWRKWAIALWLLTFTPLLRLLWAWEVSWLDIVYPWALMLVFWTKAAKETRYFRAERPDSPPAVSS